jgi:hypothetical protein
MKTFAKNYSIDTYDFIIITALIGGFCTDNWFWLIFFLMIPIFASIFFALTQSTKTKLTNSL